MFIDRSLEIETIGLEQNGPSNPVPVSREVNGSRLSFSIASQSVCHLSAFDRTQNPYELGTNIRPSGNRRRLAIFSHSPHTIYPHASSFNVNRFRSPRPRCRACRRCLAEEKKIGKSVEFIKLDSKPNSFDPFVAILIPRHAGYLKP